MIKKVIKSFIQPAPDKILLKKSCFLCETAFNFYKNCRTILESKFFIVKSHADILLLRVFCPKTLIKNVNFKFQNFVNIDCMHAWLVLP